MATTSIPISQLNKLNILTTDDYFPVVDSGSITTYKTTIDVLNNWFYLSGSVSSSIVSTSSSFSTSASYASSSGYSLFSDQSISSSYAKTSSVSFSSSYAKTASFSLSSSYAYQSTLAYWADGASWANVAGLAYTASLANTASNLNGNGTSKEQTLILSSSLIMGQNSMISLKRRVGDGPSLGELWTDSSIVFNKFPYLPPYDSNDFARIYFVEGNSFQDEGRLVFEHGDNNEDTEPMGPDIETIYRNNPGFLYRTMNTLYQTASLFFIQTSGKVYGRGFCGRVFSSSLSSGIGFAGTASYAMSSPEKSYALIHDRRVGGNAEVAAFGAWTRKEINTIYGSTAGVSIVGGNKFSLPAGTYNIEALQLHAQCICVLKLYNETTASDINYGSWVNSGNNAWNVASVTAIVTLATTTTLSLQYYLINNGGASNWLGSAVNIPGIPETFTTIKILQL